jgi:hypothetical protein
MWRVSAAGIPLTARFAMHEIAMTVMPVAAIGYSLLYLLFGGGFFGAVVIFFVAKMLGK